MYFDGVLRNELLKSVRCLKKIRIFNFNVAYFAGGT